MRRTQNRAKVAPRIEFLEGRTLLSIDTPGVMKPPGLAALQGDPGSIDSDHILVRDPQGAPETAVTAVGGSGHRQFDASFANRSAADTYRLLVGPNVRDLAGNPLDQNRNGINGEPADSYAAALTIGSTDSVIGSDAVYEARPAPYQAINLVPGAAGVRTLRSSGDDRTVSVSLGGRFNFYGTTYTTAYVSTNGLITFGGSTASASNTPLTSGPKYRSIAPLWDDWTSTAGNAILLSRVDDLDRDGTADRVVFEWNKVQGYYRSPSTVTFQVILELNTGSTPGAITFNYPDLYAGNFRTNGGSATVGIKDLGTQATRRIQVSYNSGSNQHVASGKAIRFTPKGVAQDPPPTEPPPQLSAPAAPSHLTATAVSPSQVNLSWADNATNEIGYRIERSRDGVTWSTVGSVAANTTKFSNTGLAANTTYRYRVLALGSELNSAPSNVATVTTPAAPTTPPTSPGLSAIEQRIIELVNLERQRAGLAPLAVSTKLVQAAGIHSDQMVTYGRMAHSIPGAPYPSPADRLAAVGYRWRSYGENIAYGYRDAEAVMAGWMSSSGHRANILNANYTEIGVGVSYDSAGRPYYCQVFGRPA